MAGPLRGGGGKGPVIIKIWTWTLSCYNVFQQNMDCPAIKKITIFVWLPLCINCICGKNACINNGLIRFLKRTIFQGHFLFTTSFKALLRKINILQNKGCVLFIFIFKSILISWDCLCKIIFHVFRSKCILILRHSHQPERGAIKRSGKRPQRKFQFIMPA